MPSQYRHRRSSNPANAFPSPLEPGEIAVNTANRQLALGDANAGSLGAVLPLLAIRFFDARAQYVANDYVLQAGVLYRANGSIPPGAFNASNWTVITSPSGTFVLRAGDTMTGHLSLPTAPAAANAVRKDYVDGAINAAATAGGVTFTPVGGITASNVQAAIAEVDTEKVAKAGDTMTGHLSLPTAPAAANAVRKDYVDAYAAPNANVLINGDFRVNQIGYASAAALAAGSYGHDQWKAGAAGGDYSFTQLKSSTQITIASGKSLIQPIEDVNVVGGSYVLSWTGTAQARAGVNSFTPSGAYAASPLSIGGQAAGTGMSVEFNAGTLGTVKLERGSVATPFVMRPYDQELLACQRYYQRFGEAMVSCDNAASVGQLFYGAFLWKPILRAAPTVNVYTMSAGNAGTASLASVSADVVNVQAQAAALGGAWVSLSIHGAARL